MKFHMPFKLFSILFLISVSFAQANIIKNGDFKQFDSSNKGAAGWNMSGLVAERYFMTVPELPGKPRAFCINTKGIGRVVLSQEIQASPNNMFKFSAWIKSPDKVVVSFGKRALAYFHQGKWQKVTGLVRTGQDGKLSLRISIGGLLTRPSITQIADVSLQKINMPHVKYRPGYGSTIIAEGGHSTVWIVYPSGDEKWKPLAQKIAQAIKSKTGISPATVSDVEITEKDSPAIRKEFRDKNLIILGRLGVNRAIWTPYNRYLCAVDGYYPGKDGYVVRTAANVLRNGKNEIIVGSSSFEGNVLAVDKFCEIINRAEMKDGKLVLPWLLDIKLSGKVLDAFKHDDAIWKNETDDSGLPPVQPGYGTVRRWYHNTMGYYWTGWDSYKTRSRRELAQVLEDNAYTHHYLAEFLVRTYDMIDDSDIYTPEEKEAMDNLILKNYWEFANGPDLTWMTTFSPPYDFISIVNRHQIAPWMSAYMLAKFVNDYLTLPPQASEMAKFSFEEISSALADFVKNRWTASLPGGALVETREETVASFFRFAMDNDIYEFFNNRNAEKSAEIDKLNHLSGSSITPPGTIDHKLINGMIANYYNDGRYAAFCRELPLPMKPEENFQGRYVCQVHLYYPGKEIASASTDDFIGVRRNKFMQHDLTHLSNLNNKTYKLDKQIQPDQMATYVLFRSGFKPQDDSVCIAGTQSSASAPGTLICFASGGANWLDAGHSFGQASPRYFDSNAVSILRLDKWTEPDATLPAAARILWLADFKRSGGVNMEISPVDDTKWNREIIWVMPGVYIFRDKVTALHNGKFDVRVIWRPAGQAQWDGKTWTATQKYGQLKITPLGKDFHVEQNVSQVDKNPDLNLKFMNRVTKRFQKDESVVSTTVLNTIRSCSIQSEFIDPDETELLLKDGNKPLAVISWKGECGNIQSDADVLLIQNDTIKAFNATKLAIRDKVVFSSPNAANVDLKSSVSVDVLNATIKGILENAAKLKNNKISSAQEQQVIVDKTADWKKQWVYKGLLKPAKIDFRILPDSNIADLGENVTIAEIRAKLATRKWSPSPLPDKIMVAEDDGSGKVPPADSNRWVQIKSKYIWKTSIQSGNYGQADKRKEGFQVTYPDIKARFVMTDGLAHLNFYQNGKQEARQRVKICIEDTDNDGQKEIFAYPNVWPEFLRPFQEQVEAWALLDSSGKEIAKYESPSNIQKVRMLDLDGNGKKSIIQATIDAQVEIFDSHGKPRENIDLYAMHENFNRTKGRPNTRQPAGGYTRPFGIGLWRPDNTGRQKIIISRYGNFSFLDTKSKFEGVLASGYGYVLPELLPYGVDFNGDGAQEQFCLGRGCAIQLSGDPIPNIVDPNGHLFFPQVYTQKFIHAPTMANQIDGAAVLNLSLLKFGNGKRFVLAIRENYLAIYDGRENKWAFAWVPSVGIIAACLVQDEKSELGVTLVTSDGLLWNIKWKNNLEKISTFKVKPINFSVLDMCYLNGKIFMAGFDGIFMLDSQNGTYQKIADGVFQAIAAEENCLVAADSIGRILKFTTGQ